MAATSEAYRLAANKEEEIEARKEDFARQHNLKFRCRGTD
jgi:hypothetical protein